eukprot:scaffold155114_cov19-Prasinocladus_malaysianus.AAC.1
MACPYWLIQIEQMMSGRWRQQMLQADAFTFRKEFPADFIIVYSPISLDMILVPSHVSNSPKTNKQGVAEHLP